MSMQNVLSTVWQAVGYHNRGKRDINIHLVKPAWFLPDAEYAIIPSMSDNVVQDECFPPVQEYVTYPYYTAQPVLRWLPTKLA